MCRRSAETSSSPRPTRSMPAPRSNSICSKPSKLLKTGSYPWLALREKVRNEQSDDHYRRDASANGREITIHRQRAVRGQPELRGEDFAVAGHGSLRNDPTIGRHGLGNAGTGDAENRDAVFRRAHRRDARMQFVLMPAPGFHVHRRTDDELRALPHQFVRDARVAQVVADAEADLAPRRIPDFLLRRGQAVLEKLDRHALDLLEHNFAVCADDECGVVIIALVVEKIFAADDQKPRMFAAPV